jgi:hypothetical protein
VKFIDDPAFLSEGLHVTMHAPIRALDGRFALAVTGCLAEAPSAEPARFRMHPMRIDASWSAKTPVAAFFCALHNISGVFHGHFRECRHFLQRETGRLS